MSKIVILSSNLEVIFWIFFSKKTLKISPPDLNSKCRFWPLKLKIFKNPENSFFFLVEESLIPSGCFYSTPTADSENWGFFLQGTWQNWGFFLQGTHHMSTLQRLTFFSKLGFWVARHDPKFDPKKKKGNTDFFFSCRKSFFGTP